MSLEAIVAFAKSKIGCGYVYGATGWICSAARRQQQANQYPEYANTILTTCAKWDGKQCFDCAQLTKAAAAAAGVTLPSGATSQWNSAAWAEKGTIDTMPDKPGIILYRQEGSRMQHTEVYAGDRETIGARSSSKGVGRFSMDGYNWTHWALPKVSGSAPDPVEPEKVIREAVVTKIAGATGNTVNLRKSASISAPVLARVPFGTAAHITAEVESWAKFAYNGFVGWMMSKYLLAPGDGAEGAQDAPATRRTVKMGSSGEDVRMMQEKLIALGYDLGATGADGKFGVKTYTAVWRFQIDRNLTLDGIVGPQTWEALEEV